MTVDTKFQAYIKLIKGVQDKDGFIESETCDALLFSALVGCVQGVDVNIDAAAAFGGPQDGLWLRRPFTCGTCLSDGWSRTLWQRIKGCAAAVLSMRRVDTPTLQALFSQGNSTISRDMLTGLAWYAWCNKRLDIAEGVVRRALKQWGRVGNGDPSKTNIMPGLLATYAWISYKLGGPSRPWLRWIPADFGSKVTGYQAHLQVLHLLLRARLAKEPLAKYAKILNYQAKREPNNALFQYAAMHAGAAPNSPLWLLSNEKWWPEDRLPTTNDRSEQWLFQRDYGPDWEPLLNWNLTHSGGDFLFLYALMSGQLK